MKRISVEEMVRRVIAAIQADQDLLERVWLEEDQFTAGDLAGPANALTECLYEDKLAAQCLVDEVDEEEA